MKRLFYYLWVEFFFTVSGTVLVEEEHTSQYFCAKDHFIIFGALSYPESFSLNITIPLIYIIFPFNLLIVIFLVFYARNIRPSFGIFVKLFLSHV